MTSILNPNSSKPTLVLIGKKPIALAAFKAKIRLVEPEPVAPTTGRQDQGLAHPASASGQERPQEIKHDEADRHAHAPLHHANDVALLPKPKRRPGEKDVDLIRPNAASQVESPGRFTVRAPNKLPDAPQPFAYIEGQVSDFPASWTTSSERAAALGRWISHIAREVAKLYETKDECDSAEAFVRGHRMSIANAFQRRLVRKDVVAALGEMFREASMEIDIDPGHSLG